MRATPSLRLAVAAIPTKIPTPQWCPVLLLPCHRDAGVFDMGWSMQLPPGTGCLHLRAGGEAQNTKSFCTSQNPKILLPGTNTFQKNLPKIPLPGILPAAGKSHLARSTGQSPQVSDVLLLQQPGSASRGTRAPLSSFCPSKSPGKMNLLFRHGHCGWLGSASQSCHGDA